jgi:GNAT superfamily N-acetyltransferase
MGETPQIECATADDTDGLSHLIAAAFDPLASSAWLVSDAAERRRVFPPYFRLHVEQALHRGAVEVTQDRMAVALWFPIAPAGLPALDKYEERLAEITGAHVEQFRAFDIAMGERHPHSVQHDYLGILAVHPSRQGQGLGNALLAHHHRQLDHQTPPVPTYLEADDLRGRAFYLRHGYRDLGEPIRLPAGPLTYPMWRSPGSPVKPVE